VEIDIRIVLHGGVSILRLRERETKSGTYSFTWNSHIPVFWIKWLRRIYDEG
jgi:hypothetical protein